MAQQGWLQKIGRGKFRCCGSGHWPQVPKMRPAQTHLHQLGPILADIAFLHPELAVVLSDLWGEDIAESLSPRRLFIQMDYILSDEQHQQVDDYHEQLERSWGRMIQFEYNTREAGILSLLTYPVCLHYVRRAKYLSAYGETPGGDIGWHNFRLDRICSRRLTSLDWQDERIPQPLQALHQSDCLPSPEAVQEELEEAWGFNFYLPKALLILRFSPEFAQRYVDNTQRHLTFRLSTTSGSRL
ncbi:MAG: TIGR03985 family CRISPR-associated protein [Synechococcaceae cyanobacterium SM2_3_2]|nr:TIGR03985 family CRISPR-associated protein [Synechococcaceae cyanobacterium SM2_3_2]